jgi:hypothetical protein
MGEAIQDSVRRSCAAFRFEGKAAVASIAAKSTDAYG